MKHQTIEQVRLVGDVQSQAPKQLTAIERLERWAEVLECQPERKLRTLFQTEWLPCRERDKLSAKCSAISVAFVDPILRREGLLNESYGEAKRFFQLSDSELHWIVCSCHHGETLSARRTARIVRQIISERNWSLSSMLRQWFGVYAPNNS